MLTEINSFRGEYYWLSNFYPVDIFYKGRLYPSVEHAFMSSKSDSEEWKIFCSDSSNPPGKVKVAGRTVKLVDNWNNIRIQVMRECILLKFSQEPFKSKLLSTGNINIVEGNDWGDTYWGFDIRKGKGKNYLGRIIMETRDILKN